ncbi:type II toxin-antitoxin system VapB family antitoxin [Streptomyces sp. NPDC097619]|uniref:type II toxin-antitoxin system VapB family antitoxin n=1 Tax=Streptomyces sp. NPDC097619 TaxID=3157228 RepID=UPI00331B09EA
MARTMIDLDDEMVERAKEIYGTKTKAAAVRAAVEDAVRRHLRQQFVDAVKSGEISFDELIERTATEAPQDSPAGRAVA